MRLPCPSTRPTSRAAKPRRLRRLPIAALLLAPAWPLAAETPTPDPAAFPELSPERTLPVLAQALHDTLVDPASATNFLACYPPVKIRWVGGRPERWTVMFALNSKNPDGGYTGLTEMAAVFHATKPVEVSSIGTPPSARERATCLRLPDAELHRLMDAQ